MSKISPCLWFDGQAEEAAQLYTSLVPDSRIDSVNRAPADHPSGSAGDVLTVEFTLAGESYIGLNGGPHFKFTERFPSSSIARTRPRSIIIGTR
jgi:predicted 3-demethylubiquinone-9 3-methyltransferase (glyoxalase superfamily)